MEVGDATDKIMDLIASAHAESLMRHGKLRANPVRASLILLEECGEVGAEALKLTNPNGTGSHRGAVGTRQAMLRELAQVVQHAMAMMVNLLEEESPSGNERT